MNRDKAIKAAYSFAELAIDAGSVRTLINKIYDDFEQELQIAVSDKTCYDCKHKYVLSHDRIECKANDSIVEWIDEEGFPDFGCNQWEERNCES